MTKDPVNHPSHYTRSRFETIEVIEEWGLDFCLGNTVKYISRAGHKDPAKEIEDLRKARWYLDRRLQQLGAADQRSSLELVREFHKTFGQVINDEPVVNDRDLNLLRIELLNERIDELAEALDARDPAAVLGALTDLQYVLDGAYLSLGFHHVKDAALAEVHRSNMSKLGEDGKPVYRDDGKILKGPSYSPPDLVQFVSAPPSESPNEFASAGGGATVNSTGGCPDCQSAYGEPHLSHCPWRVIVPGKGER